MNLESTIMNLIKSNKEGVYYDFKRQWLKNIDLLKSIVSLANCKHDGDRYLIIGIDESNDNFKVNGLENSKRKTQAELQDLLDNYSFAGDNIPDIQLETLNLKDSNGVLKEIDVIIIKNTNNKPYYLEKCKGFTNYAIWTRHNDKNSIATYYEVEEMWKERFGLNNSEKENFKRNLKDCEHWEYNKEDNVIYYVPNSDYKICLGEIDYTRDMKEPFSKFYLDDTFNICKASFKVRDTTIFSCEYIFCDGFGTEFPVPSLKTINHETPLNGFYYYLLDDFIGLFANMIFEMFNGAECRFYEFPYLFFNDKDDLNKFTTFLENFDEKIDIPKRYYPIGAHKDAECFRNIDLYSLRKNKYIYDFIYDNENLLVLK